jgi:Flp pilus assembly protein TadD
MEQEPTVEDDLQLAWEALREGNAVHAAHHVAAVLSRAPEHDEVSDLVAELVRIAPADLVSLAPLEEDAFTGTVALRALLLDRVGRTAEAVPLLLRLLSEAPASWGRWARLLGAWIERDDAVAELDVDLFLNACVRCLDVGADPREVLPLVASIAARFGEHPTIAFLHAKVLCACDRPEEAVVVATRGLSDPPSYWPLVGLADALRACGRLSEALTRFEQAMAAAPTPDLALAASLLVGDTCLDLGRDDAARAAYERVLDVDPNQPLAVSAMAYLHAKGGDDQARFLLEGMAGDPATAERAGALLRELDPESLVLAPPASSIVNQARGWVARREPLTSAVSTISSLEPPSAVASYRQALRDIGTTCELPVVFLEVPSPDPRLPSREVEPLLWSYAGPETGELTTSAEPAVGPPDGEITDRIAELAATREVCTWPSLARAAAEEMGASRVGSLLAVMVHPPPTPEGYDAWDWIFRVQVAAAMVVSWIDEGWHGSVRERALSALLHGPLDWTTTAGIIAVVELARADASLSPTLQDQVLGPLFGEVESPIHFQCVIRPLVEHVPRIPDIPAASRLALIGMKAQLDVT